MTGICSDCGEACSIHDVDGDRRRWRHLDRMQFETIIVAQIPRVRCQKHGVKSVQLPWAEKHSRFTLFSESFALQVLQIARSLEEARKLLGLNWHQLNAIKRRGVERGLQKACETAIDKALTKCQRNWVEAVAIDMWPAFINGVGKALGEIVHDRFHISKPLNEVIDKVRREEHAMLKAQGDDRLTKTRYHWLKNEENLLDEARKHLKGLKNSELKPSLKFEGIVSSILNLSACCLVETILQELVFMDDSKSSGADQERGQNDQESSG